MVTVCLVQVQVCRAGCLKTRALHGLEQTAQTTRSQTFHQETKWDFAGLTVYLFHSAFLELIKYQLKPLAESVEDLRTIFGLF